MADPPLPTAPFGRTGHLSTRVVFGAAAIGGVQPEQADLVLADVLAAGINHIDTAHGYGRSEVHLRGFLADHRDEVFLATKTGGRTAAAARAELERSLERMGVDAVDLIQLHNLVEPDEWETAHRPGGAVAALAQARDEGLVRFIGVTGHGLRIPGMHLRSLAEFDYDSVLFPYNQALLDVPAYRADADRLLALCAERDVAVQTIKAVARRRWADPHASHRSWYEPLDDAGAIGRAVRFVLAQPRLFLNSSSDYQLLTTITAAAVADGPVPTADELRADMAEFGVTPLFDGAALERI